MTWHVLRTEFQKERGACAWLRRIPYVEPLMPTLRRRAVIRNKVTHRLEIMLPGYLLMRVPNMTQEVWSKVNATPGVHRMMMGAGGNKPIIIDNHIVVAILAKMAEEEQEPKFVTKFTHRQPVILTEKAGSLAGLDCVYSEGPANRPGVMLKLFGRESWHPIPASWMKAA